MSRSIRQKSPGRTGAWSERKIITLITTGMFTTVVLGVYVLLYPVYAILDYFHFISSDHGVGRVLYVVFMPLAYWEVHSETVNVFFDWLKNLYLDPFFP